VTAIYLFSCASSNMIGLYYLPLVLLCEETGIPLEGATKALQSLIEAHFCDYCPREQMIWVPEMARIQIADKLAPSDNRIKGIIREASKYRKSRFFNEFMNRYRQAFHLSSLLKIEAPSKPIRRGFKDPTKPRAGTGA